MTVTPRFVDGKKMLVIILDEQETYSYYRRRTIIHRLDTGLEVSVKLTQAQKGRHVPIEKR